MKMAYESFCRPQPKEDSQRARILPKHLPSTRSDGCSEQDLLALAVESPDDVPEREPLVLMA
jgi:hypothetical protein